MTSLTIAPGETAPSSRQLMALVGRSLRKTIRNPQLLMYSSMMPFAMLVLFSQVFRSIADGPRFPPGVGYIDFLAPALLAVSTVMAATNSGVAMATDLSGGMVDRLYAMPVRRWTPLAARAITDLLLTVLRVLVLGVAAYVLLGFRLHGSFADTLLAVVVLLPVSFAMSWLFLLIGARLRDPAVVQTSGMMVMMPFMFISSAFAPLETMPGWLQTLAEVNPVTHTADAARSYVLGTPDHSAAGLALLTSAALAILTIAATTISLRRL